MTKKKHKVLPTEMLDSFKYIVAEELGLLDGKLEDSAEYAGNMTGRLETLPDSSGVAEYNSTDSEEGTFTGE